MPSTTRGVEGPQRRALLGTLAASRDKEMAMDEMFDAAEQAFMHERYNLSAEELAARVRAAPDQGGAMLVQLREFGESRQDQDE